MNRRMLPLLVWVVALVAGTALFHAMGDGPLAAPPLDPSSWSAWLDGREPLVATVAILRLVVLALSWYLVGATTIGILARLLRAARLVRLADALTVPALRRLLQGALGMSLATAMVTSATPSAVTPAGDAGRPADDERTATVAAGADDLDGVDDADDAEVALTSLRPAAGTGHDGEGVTLTRVGDDGSGAADPDGGEVTLEHAARDRPPPIEVLDDLEAGRLARDGDPGQDGSVAEPTEASGEEDLAGGPGDHPADTGTSDADGAATAATGEDVPADADGTGTGDPDGTGASVDDGAATHTVAPGDSLWSIARDHLAATTGSVPTDAEVTPYWERLIAANEDRLADPGNPDLIFPGQRFTLPDVGTPAR